ncbi:MAG: hypothetical protein BMS9Abin26_0814 [Gammaproteobacteria bacterium]|nr:MAG: hypothetical protein BMS9Abin26_0814 [Gammaproteobacteria bacterium]
MVENNIPAKVIPPELHNVYDRTRLFARLDDTDASPITWLVAPEGAGKSTLVSSYVRKRELHCLWYTLDAEDADPANFLHYLDIAAQKVDPQKSKSLPELTAEYKSPIEEFVREYIKQLLGVLPEYALLVFDNFQEIPVDSGLHSILCEVISDVVGGRRILILSRQSPPAAYELLLTNNDISVIDWNEMKLTEEETGGIVDAYDSVKDGVRRHPYDPETIRQLYFKSQGWAAGLTLLLDTGENEDESIWRVIGEATDAINYDVLMNMLFTQANEKTQRFLLKCGLLPRMTIDVLKAFTGEKNPQALLDMVNRQHYFVIEHAGDTPYYQFHPMFKKYLSQKLEDKFSAEEIHDLRREAARVLQENGMTDEADVLLQENEE